MSRLDEAAKAVLKECFFNNNEDSLAGYVTMANNYIKDGGIINSQTPYMMAAILITEE